MSKKEKVHIGKDLRVLKRHRRTYFDILADISGASTSGITNTNLMYRCNLSFRQLKKYLGLSVQKGWLRSVVAKKSFCENLFETTKKGKEFLRTYKRLEALLTS